MIDTILFDLDGTLLSMDTEEFIKHYFIGVSKALNDYFTFDEVVKYFWSSTQYMIENTEADKTNEEAFFEDFNKQVKTDEKLIKVLDDFYNTDFNEIQKVSSKNQYILEAVKVLKAKGYDLVIATNPLFPINATLNRIKWAGLDVDDFIFVTSFEEMHYCKPQPLYYQEVLAKINKKAENCLMVGNDIVEDMIAKEVGIQTFLITNNIIGNINDDKNVDHSGDYQDFYNFVGNLKEI